jgi:hypothetical protein
LECFGSVPGADRSDRDERRNARQWRDSYGDALERLGQGPPTLPASLRVRTLQIKAVEGPTAGPDPDTGNPNAKVILFAAPILRSIRPGRLLQVLRHQLRQELVVPDSSGPGNVGIAARPTSPQIRRSPMPAGVCGACRHSFRRLVEAFFGAMASYGGPGHATCAAEELRPGPVVAGLVRPSNGPSVAPFRGISSRRITPVGGVPDTLTRR